MAMEHKILTLFALALGIHLSESVGDVPTISTISGDVSGLSGVTESGKIVYKYLNIPFAAPPVGNLRFKPPSPHPGWQGTVRDGTGLGNACIQTESRRTLPEGVAEDEDCLTLNIYIPETSETAPMPVMVFIHDGVFMWANSWLYDGSILASYGDVIVVLFNYRLGLLGWISSGNRVIPGNMGFFDQLEALKWVKNSAGLFGGDPNAITVFGLSSGAESIIAHLSSPLSRGLFSRAIVQSSPITRRYPYKSQQKKYFREFAAHLNCTRRHTRYVVKCLRQLPVEYFRSSFYKSVFPDLANTLAWRVIDGKFLTDQPVATLQSGKFNDVDLIIGFASHDGNTMLVTGFAPLGVSLTDVVQNGVPSFFPPGFILRLAAQTVAIFVSSQYAAFVTPEQFAVLPNGNLMVTMIEQEFYTAIGGDKARELQALFDVTTTSGFSAFAVSVANTFTATPNTTTYVYQLSHFLAEGRGEYGGGIINIGAFHADDLFYLFDEIPLTVPTALAVREAILSAWTSFAKTGTPVFADGTAWPAYDSASQQIWDFSSENGGAGAVKTAIFAKWNNFWNNIIEPVSQLYPICKK